MLLRTVFALALTAFCALAVDRNNFKTCDQSGFCKRHRTADKRPEYEVIVDSITNNGSAVVAKLKSSVNTLQLTIVSLRDLTIRVVIDEVEGALRKRYQPLDALNDGYNLKMQNSTFYQKDAAMVTFGLQNGVQIMMAFKPFQILVYMDGEIVIGLNSHQLLKFEHFREKVKGKEKDDGEGFWEETFKTHTDSKPYGSFSLIIFYFFCSSSVGMDISFIGFKFVYGLPEHGDTFVLRSTTAMDPYRLYNLDVFEYELNSQMSLYGAVPFLLAHSKDRTVGVLWLNAAETWVDIKSPLDSKGILGSLADKLKITSDEPEVSTHFMSETGLIDIFIMLGPKPVDLFRQNAALTGIYPLPPLFSLAYHQCRWNYNDQDDVAAVHAGFDTHDIPMDVIWLDIEHTDGKRYFTWDPVKFPNPLEMINALSAKGRKMVSIIDPHVKKDDNYDFYKRAKELGYFVKNKDGSDYEAHCWPGASMYLDLLNPEVRKFWASQFAFDKYIGSTKDLFTWNDMNEPSVFSGPEGTMHKDTVHHGGWEHRDVHNIYGFYHHGSTYKGQIDRTGGKLRPFILTRSFFVGSQRTTAVWTGDNTADWGHLKASVPMLLSLSISGIPHVGADVGGFFNNPDEELLVRWYQAAAFQPFFRSHAHIDTKRREPWLFSEKAVDAIRKAIKLRYSLLPYWYTLFYEYTLTGKPPMLPLWAEFPDDETSFDEEREWLVGANLLIRPVMDPSVERTSLYLPGRRKVVWYEWNTSKPKPAPGAVYVDSPLDAIPLFQRGGSIIPVWGRVRRASTLMRQDPITLYVAANSDGTFANGTLYMDDGESFEYKTGQYLYWSYTYKKESDLLYSLTSKNLDKKGVMDRDIFIERIVIRGVRYFPRNVHMYLDDWNPEDLEFDHDRNDQTLIIRKPDAPVSAEFRIDIHMQV
uniref:Gal_mutarotas_2 domain-containing protein n=1 Tax=Syphacia muris TaxID=451379 RepID=A0A158R447_9BILA